MIHWYFDVTLWRQLIPGAGVFVCYLFMWSIFLFTNYSTEKAMPTCQPRTEQREALKIGDCVSTSPVLLSYCSGLCESNVTAMMNTIFNGAPYLDMNCNCCKPTAMGENMATFLCADGTTIEKAYYVIEQCDCRGCEYDPITMGALNPVPAVTVPPAEPSR